MYSWVEENRMSKIMYLLKIFDKYIFWQFSSEFPLHYSYIIADAGICDDECSLIGLSVQSAHTSNS